MPSRLVARVAVAAVVLTAGPAALAGTATFPYTESFDGQSAAPPATNIAGQTWAQGTPGVWSVITESGLDKAYRWLGSQSTAGAATNGTSSFAVSSGLPTAGSFSISTEFTLAQNSLASSGDNRVGLALFGTNAAFGGGSTAPYYLADVMTAFTGGPKIIRIINVNGTNPELDGTVTGNFDLNTVYTLTVNGTLTGNTIALSATVSGGSVSGSSPVFTDTARLTGTNFGYRNRASVSGGTPTGTSTLDAAFDNYRLVTAVPEPGTVGLVGAGAVGLLARRRQSVRRHRL